MLHVSLLQTLISNSQFLKPAITWFLLFERTEQWISWWYSMTYTCYPFCRKGLEIYELKRALIYTLCHLLKYLSQWHLGLQFLLLSFSHSVVSDSLQPPKLQRTRLPCPLPSPRACSNACPLSQWCHPTISSSVASFSPTFNLSQHQGLFWWVGSSHQVAKVLALQLQHQSF